MKLKFRRKRELGFTYHESHQTVFLGSQCLPKYRISKEDKYFVLRELDISEPNPYYKYNSLSCKTRSKTLKETIFWLNNSLGLA